MRLLPVLTSPDRVREFKEYRRYFRIIPDKVLENVYERVFSSKTIHLAKVYASEGETLRQLSDEGKIKYIIGLEKHERLLLSYLLISLDKRFYDIREEIARMLGYSSYKDFVSVALRYIKLRTGVRELTLRNFHLYPEGYAIFWGFTTGYIGYAVSGYIMGYHLGDGSIRVRDRKIKIEIPTTNLDLIKPILNVLNRYRNTYTLSRRRRVLGEKVRYELYSEDFIMQSLCFLWGYYYALELSYGELSRGLLVGIINSDGTFRVEDDRVLIRVFQGTSRVEEIPLVNEALVLLHELANGIRLQHTFVPAYITMDILHQGYIGFFRRKVVRDLVRFAMDKGLPIKIPSKIIEKILR